MIRKVAKIGPSTLMVSLPNKWVKQHHIQKGQELEVQEKEGSLLIYPSSHQGIETAEIKLEKKDQFLKRYLRSLYHRGFSEVKITCEDGIDINEIKKELDTYLGFEIMEQGKNYCIIKNVAETVEGEFDVVLRKIFFMNAGMADDSLDQIKSNNYASLNDIAAIERTNNKLVNLCYRILNKSGKMSDSQSLSIYTTLSSMENIADHYRDICLYANEKKVKLSKNLEEFYKKVNLHYHQISGVYYKFDPMKAVDLRNNRILLINSGYKLCEKLSNEETRIIHHLLSVMNEMKDLELSLGFERV